MVAAATVATSTRTAPRWWPDARLAAQNVPSPIRKLATVARLHIVAFTCKVSQTAAQLGIGLLDSSRELRQCDIPVPIQQVADFLAAEVLNECLLVEAGRVVVTAATSLPVEHALLMEAGEHGHDGGVRELVVGATVAVDSREHGRNAGRRLGPQGPDHLVFEMPKETLGTLAPLFRHERSLTSTLALRYQPVCPEGLLHPHVT